MASHKPRAESHCTHPENQHGHISIGAYRRKRLFLTPERPMPEGARDGSDIVRYQETLELADQVDAAQVDVATPPAIELKNESASAHASHRP